MNVKLLGVNAITLGVLEEQVLTSIEWTDPTPLPFGPASVCGVVSIQGRMFTVVDVGLILGSQTGIQEPRFIVALRGDEQLALAVTEANDIVEIDPKEITPEAESTLVRGKIQLDGKEISLLDIDALFAGVIRGRERRKRRL